MKEEISVRLNALRKAMSEAGVYAAIIPQNDPHQSEYIADHWQIRRYLSGFTGSAGDLVVTPDKALLWTDSRYFIQAANQLDGTEIKLMKDGLSETPSITAWLTANCPKGSVVGIDGLMFAHKTVERMQRALALAGISLATDFNPIDSLWPDRPQLPTHPVFIHDIKYAGHSASDKIAAALKNAAAQGAEAILVNDLAEIAWILNIRSSDVNCNPVAISYLYLSPEGSTLIIDPAKLTDEVKAHLAEAGVGTAPYADALGFAENIKAAKVLVDADKVTERMLTALGDMALQGESTVAMAKACKNRVQVEGTRAAMERDGVALVRAFMEIEKRVAEGVPTTEMDVADILLHHRSADAAFVDLSFETIAGYGPHGAIVHYTANKESDATLRPEGLLLVDSGAQYPDGTTDITRTVALGTPTKQEMTDFTLVMKGHIALGTAIFPEGTRGAQLDALARQFLWQHGLSYLHGTGHGVGHFLNVHEGPQSIRLNENPTPLTPGMITSNEPGVYRENVHGIRCENLVLTVPAFTTEFGNFLKFETLTLFPFDRSLFDLSIMTPAEVRWVNDYHATVYARLSPALNPAEQAWLRKATLPLGE